MKESLCFVYDADKSKQLRQNRGIGFEEIIEFMEQGNVLGTRPHPNQIKYPNQWLYEINVGGYIYVVPFYIHGKLHELRTLYPSRVATKKHKERGYEKEHPEKK